MDPRAAFLGLKSRVQGLKTRQVATLLAAVFLEAAAIGIAALALLVAVEIVLRPAGGLRAAAAGLIGLGALVFIVSRLVAFARALPTAQSIARRFEGAVPTLDEGAVRSALSLWEKREEGRHGYSRTLLDAHVVETAERSQGPARGVVRKQRLGRAAGALAALLVVVAAGRVAAPGAVSAAVARIAEAGARRAPTVIVTPGDITLVQGSDLTIFAEVSPSPGSAPRIAVETGDTTAESPLERATAGSKADDGAPASGGSAATPPSSAATGASSGGATFRKTYAALSTGFEYRVVGDGWESPRYKVTLTRPPLLLSIEKRYAYPPYSGLAERVVEEGDGQVKALRGTRVALTVKSAGPIARGALQLNTGPRVPLEIAGGSTGEAKSGRATLTVGNPDRYQVALWSAQGGAAETSPVYEIAPVEDEAPIVTLLSPASDTTLSRDLILDVAASVLDDFGVSKMALVWSQGEGETRVPIELGGARGGEIDAGFTWDLSEVEMLPGHTLSFFVEAWDNDAVSGPKRGVSRTVSLRFPTLAEIYDEVHEAEAGQTESLTEAFEESMGLKEKIEAMSREMKRERDSASSWEKKEEVESVIKKQEEISEQLSQVSKEIDETMEKLERNDLVNPEILQKMAEVRRLMDKVATPEMKAAMERLRSAMEKLDPKEIAEASKNLKMNQEEFLKRLDRTIEMLKSVQQERRVEEMVRSMEELADRQESLQEATEKSTTEAMKSMAPDQDAVKKETEDAMEKMDDLAQEMKKDEQAAAEEIEKTAEEMRQESTPQTMSMASQGLRGGQKQSAQSEQKKASKNLRSAQQGLENALEMMNARQDEAVRKALEKAIGDLVYLSRSEEGLVGKSERAGSRGAAGAPQLARQQAQVGRGIETVAGELDEAMKKTMHIGPSVPEILRRARENAGEAEQALAQGNSRVGSMLGNRTMAGVNEGLVKLLEAQKDFESSCQNAQSSGQCNNPSLNQMSQSQSNINSAAHGMAQGMGQAGERLTMQDGQRLSQLAAEQQAIRQGLEEFSQSLGEGQGLLGRLDKIAEDMKEAEEDLRARRPDEAARKGERINQRLLDADRSLRRQGYKKERTSETAKTGVGPTSPAALSEILEKADPKVREDILRTLSVRFPEEYEALIRSYFDALQKDSPGAR